MAFSGNFHENKVGIIAFFKAYNAMQRDCATEIQFDEKGQDLYDLLYLADSEGALRLERKCRALVEVMTPCFSGGAADPFARVDQVDGSEDAPISADHIADWVPERKKSDTYFSESASVGNDPEESTEREDSFLQRMKAARAFILAYLEKIKSVRREFEDGGYAFLQYDPETAKLIAQQDAPPRQRIVFYYANFEDHSDDDEDEPEPSALVSPPPPQVDANDPVQQAIKAAEEFEKFKSSWTIAGWELALAAGHKKESRKAWTNNLLSLSILPVGFGVGAAIGFGVVKLGIAAIGIAGISFPPILLIGAVVAVTAAITYCCIKKYKKSPIFTKKQRPTIPAENAMVFGAPALDAPSRLHYNRFRAFFESMHQKFSQPLTDQTSESWKKINELLKLESRQKDQRYAQLVRNYLYRYPNTDQTSESWKKIQTQLAIINRDEPGCQLTRLKNNLQQWKEEEAQPGSDPYLAFSHLFSCIMGTTWSIMEGCEYSDMQTEFKKELFGPYTKDMSSFYNDFRKSHWNMSGSEQATQLRYLRSYAAENAPPSTGRSISPYLVLYTPKPPKPAADICSEPPME